MNKILILGNLAKDPERRQTQTEMTICGFPIAVKRQRKREGDPDADFFYFTAFGKTAEVILKYCKKGSKLLVSGRIQNHAYTNEAGETVRGYNFIAEEIEFAGASASGGQSGTHGRQEAPKPPAQATYNQGDFFGDICDLPFN